MTLGTGLLVNFILTLVSGILLIRHYKFFDNEPEFFVMVVVGQVLLFLIGIPIYTAFVRGYTYKKSHGFWMINPARAMVILYFGIHALFQFGLVGSFSANFSTTEVSTWGDVANIRVHMSAYSVGSFALAFFIALIVFFGLYVIFGYIKSKKERYFIQKMEVESVEMDNAKEKEPVVA